MEAANEDQVIEVETDCGQLDVHPPSKEVERSGLERFKRWIIVGNPFFPLSVVLVLLGVFLLSGEERVFGSELNQLYFNFGSVEFYGLMVALTAVYLFRQQIYYDTLMLVVLATMPLLVPFILISQAALIGNGIMITLCVLALVLGIVQCWVMRRGVFEIPLNRGMTIFLCVILSLSLVMPIALKTLHAEVDAIVWAVQLDQVGNWSWNIVLPALVFGSCYIPSMTRRKFGDCAVGWLPAVLILLLVAGTALHLCSLGYVYSFPFNLSNLIPVIWAMTWLVWWKRDEWAPEHFRALSRFTVLLPMIFSVLAIFHSGDLRLFIISFANLMVMLAMMLRLIHRIELRVGVVASLLGTLNSVPTYWLIGWLPETTHVELMCLVGSCLVLVASLFRRTPGWGIAAGLAMVFPLSHLWLTATADWPVVGQFALLACWLHSLRWDLRERQARTLQTIMFGVWCLQSLIWFGLNSGVGRLDLPVFASLIAATAGLAIKADGRVRYGIFCGIAITMACLGGVDHVVAVSREIPTGAVVLAAGLTLFVLGTLLAKWRCRILGKPV